MGNIANVPEIINNYNAYTNGNKLIGVTGEMELPSFDAITEEVSGAGVLGTYETSTPGNYSDVYKRQVEVRSIENDLQKEVKRLLSSFVLSSVPDDGSKTEKDRSN